MPWLELLIPFLVVLSASSCLTIAAAFARTLGEAWGRSLLRFLACSAGVALVTAVGIFLRVSGLMASPNLYWLVWNLSFCILVMTSWFAITTAFLVTRSRPSRRLSVVFAGLSAGSYLGILAIGTASKGDLFFPYIGGVYVATSAYLLVGLGAALAIVWTRRRSLDAQNRGTLRRFLQVFLPLGVLFILDESIRMVVTLPWVPVLQLAPLSLYAFVTVEIALRARRPVDPGFLAAADSIAAQCGATPLTRREREILTQLLASRSNAAVAEALGIAPNTVKNHIYNLFQKVGVSSRSELLVLAAQLKSS